MADEEETVRTPRWCPKFGLNATKKRHRRNASLTWDAAPKRVLLIATRSSARALAALPVLATHLAEVHRLRVLVDENQLEAAGAHAHPVIKKGAAVDDNVHLVFCLGGDGLILHVVSTLFPNEVPPIMPFNMGSLGFLAPFNFDEHERHVAAVLQNGHRIALRMRLECKVERAPGARPGAAFHSFASGMVGDWDDDEGPVVHHVLNELVIDRGPAPYITNLEVFCDDLPVTRVQADGLIIATPTGSTAYSMSAGGSMVHPAVPAILFTPICPHSLSFRPVLFPDYVTLTIKVPENSRSGAWVAFDGKTRLELLRGDKVSVQMSKWHVPTFCKEDSTADWFRSVNACLHWNLRSTQGSGDVSESSTQPSTSPTFDELAENNF